MKKINHLIASGLVAQSDFVENLTKALDVNPKLANILVSETLPSFTQDEVLKLVSIPEKATYRSHKVDIESDFSLLLCVEYEYPKYYRTEQEAKCKYGNWKYDETEEYCYSAIVKSTSSVHVDW